jgi:hypothetical protein
MDIKRYTITLLIHRAEGPKIDDGERAELQEAHLLYRAALAEPGYLLASGPLADDDVCELSIFKVDPRMACLLEEEDPTVRAGVYTVWAIPWTPAGTVKFPPAPTVDRTLEKSYSPAGRHQRSRSDFRLPL